MRDVEKIWNRISLIGRKWASLKHVDASLCHSLMIITYLFGIHALVAASVYLPNGDLSHERRLKMTF